MVPETSQQDRADHLHVLAKRIQKGKIPSRLMDCFGVGDRVRPVESSALHPSELQFVTL